MTARRTNSCEKPTTDNPMYSDEYLFEKHLEKGAFLFAFLRFFFILDNVIHRRSPR